MDHWFDALTRRLAQPTTRRDVFKRLGATLALTSGFRLASAAGADTHRCESQVADNAIETRLAVSGLFDGMPLRLTRTTALSGKSLADNIEISDVRGRAFVSVQGAAVSGGRVQVTLSFSGPIEGIRQLTLETNDRGRTFVGELDGRKISRFSPTDGTRPLRFEDGRPEPRVSAPTGLDEAIAKLVRDAVEKRPSCAVSLRSSADPWGGALMFASHQTSDATNPKRTSECKACIAGCYVLAVVGAAAACIGTLGIGCAIGALVYAVVVDLGCVALCNIEGGFCCPKGCGEGCCTREGTCLDSGRGVCCGPNETPCHSRTCCDPGWACAHDGSCCAPGQNVCRDGCCDAECAPDGNCCRAPAYYFCEGTCCSAFNKCCKGQCCPRSRDVCHDALGCCPVICGPNCCGEGQVCRDPVDGVCGPCPAGEKPCADERRCCPEGMRCCPGNICCVGDYCYQDPSTGAWECRRLR